MQREGEIPSVHLGDAPTPTTETRGRFCRFSSRATVLKGEMKVDAPILKRSLSAKGTELGSSGFSFLCWNFFYFQCIDFSVGY